MSTSELAIVGGRPEFPEPLHVGRPNLGDRDRFMGRVCTILDAGWVTNDGASVREFEQRIAELTGTRFCIAMSSGTAALEIASRALGFTGEVIVPAFTFVATAHALMWQGIRPVFCDIDPRTHQIDPTCVEPLINHRTSGILGVHLWGRPCDVDALDQIARRHGLPLMFDACHALGVEVNGRRVGGSGSCEVFSFHATKFVNTLEGGAITTNDPELAERFRFMRNFGFSGEDCVTRLGTNGKMNEISAAMGLTLLDEMDALIDVNEARYLDYARELGTVPGLSIIDYPDGGRFNYQHVVFVVDEERLGLSREAVIAILRAENVLARRYFYPGCHRMKPYSGMHEYASVSLPAPDDVAARVVVMPTGPQLADDAVARIGCILRTAVAVRPKIERNLDLPHMTRSS